MFHHSTRRHIVIRTVLYLQEPFIPHDVRAHPYQGWLQSNPRCTRKTVLNRWLGFMTAPVNGWSFAYHDHVVVNTSDATKRRHHWDITREQKVSVWQILIENQNDLSQRNFFCDNSRFYFILCGDLFSYKIWKIFD